MQQARQQLESAREALARALAGIDRELQTLDAVKQRVRPCTGIALSPENKTMDGIPRKIWWDPFPSGRIRD
jgi:hypothetical protein